jgi:porphobilinogen synthase
MILPTRKFPATRLRRNRLTDSTRRLVAENKLSVDDLIWPIFVRAGTGTDLEPVTSMHGVFRTTLENLRAYVEPAAKLRIPALALFPATPKELKDAEGTEALNENNLICSAARILKKEFPELLLLGDVALDPYTDHGHDGVLRNDYVANDESVALLVKQSILQAQSGIDILAPSDMMDGRIAAIRAALDSENLIDTRIMSYAAKYASAFYGPYRDAIGSGAMLRGDKKTYQMDPANTDEAIQEVAMDIAEGADMVMVKPGMPYLDICRRVSETFAIPTFAYQVSGEYAMITAAAQNGWIDRERAMLESLLGFKRAGCAGILTYFAIDAARKLAS